MPTHTSFPAFMNVARACRAFAASSFAAALAIAPAAARAQSPGYTGLGDLRRVEPTASGALLIADHGSVLVESITGVGARVRVRFGDSTLAQFPAPTSFATGDSGVPTGAAKLQEFGDSIAIRAANGVSVIATAHPLRLMMRDAAGHELVHESFGAASYEGRDAHYVSDAPGTRYVGLGEQPAGVVRNGATFEFWNTDRYMYLPGQTIYSTFPFYIGIRDGVAHGVLYDSPFRGEMDFAHRLQNSVGYTAEGGVDGGELRWYVIPGPGVDSVLARYTRLTGRMPLPPRWAMGYQQSRYSYAPDSMLTNVATEFRRRDIPGDVLYLDIGYMNGYRVFTWDPKGYSHPKATLDSLGALGFKVVTIVDPGVKVDTGYRVFDQLMANKGFVTLPDGSPALGVVWPGLAAFPDFTRASVRKWWGDSQRALTDAGVRGIWNDMNEPSSFTGGTLPEIAQFDADGHPGPSIAYHNEYGAQMACASYEGLRRLQPNRRPFVVTRAGYTGVQRCSSMWTGDNRSTWEHLRLSIPMVLSLGLSGEPFAGSDIGGFAGSPSGEMYARWIQSATLLPFFRTHSSIDVPRREPWSYGPDYERAIRADIRFRYRMLPSVYTAFHQHTETGAPVVRPLFWVAPDDSAAYTAQDEYLLGDNVLVAPVVDSSAASRTVYFPAGVWYRLGNDSAYAGGRSASVSAPDGRADGGDTTALVGLPVFVRAGAVVAMQAPMLFEGAHAVDSLAVNVWPLSSGSLTSELYEDAGDGYAYEKGEYRLTHFTVARSGDDLTITASQAGSYVGASKLVIVLHAVSKPKSVRVDGRKVPVSYDAAARTASFPVPARFGKVVIE